MRALKKFQYFWFATIILAGGSVHGQAGSRILPTRAISYTRYLNKADFDQMFPGTPIEPGKTPQAAGFYVVYHHESLIYYFGPEPKEWAAELYLKDLEEVVAIVTVKRPELKSAHTYIQKFPQDIAASGSTANGSPSSKDSSESSSEQKESSPSPSSTPAPPSPPQPEPWWKKLLGVFGW